MGNTKYTVASNRRQKFISRRVSGNDGSMKHVLMALLCILAIWKGFFSGHGKVTLEPGVAVTEAPYQRELDSALKFQHGVHHITALAEFRLHAKVLSRADYSMDAGSDLVPVDLALGWQNMSDERVLQDIEISQSGRFYWWRTQTFPIPRHEIETESANMHLIPADESVEKAIKRVKQGAIIAIEGYLVNAERPDGGHWESSLSREDSGRGACELVWVKSFQIVKGS